MAGLVLAVVATLWVSAAGAIFHTWLINEIYSNGDGTLQFVELREAQNSDFEGFFVGHRLTSSDGTTSQALTFASNLPSTATASKSVLIATQAFADLGLVTPDYIIPAGFIPTGGGTLNFASVDAVTFSALPSNGCSSINRSSQSQTNSPTNFSGSSSAISCTTPQTGWWWNPNESGRGFSLEFNARGRIFFSSYLYAADGSPLWFIASGATSTPARFAATLTQYGSGQTLTGSYRAPSVAGTSGTVTLAFSSTTSGTLTWAGGTIPIQRFDIVTGGAALGPAAGMPETGWWWNSSESGRGFFIEVQGSTMFVSGFMYDDQGRPAWYVSIGAMTGTTVYQGTLQRYANGQTLTGAYQAPSAPESVGTITLQFSSTTAATLTLPNGSQVALARFTF
jgi:hypothetical protein